MNRVSRRLTRSLPTPPEGRDEMHRTTAIRSSFTSRVAPRRSRGAMHDSWTGRRLSHSSGMSRARPTPHSDDLRTATRDTTRAFLAHEYRDPRPRPHRSAPQELDRTRFSRETAGRTLLGVARRIVHSSAHLKAVVPETRRRGRWHARWSGVASAMQALRTPDRRRIQSTSWIRGAESRSSRNILDGTTLGGGRPFEPMSEGRPQGSEGLRGVDVATDLTPRSTLSPWRGEKRRTDRSGRVRPTFDSSHRDQRKSREI